MKSSKLPGMNVFNQPHLTMRSIFLAPWFAMVLASCSYQTDVTGDSRFKSIIPCQTKTKIAHRLYGFGYQPKPGALYDLTITNEGSADLIGIVPAGSPLKLTRVVRFHDIGIHWERVEGEVSFKGVQYPFAFHLGTFAYPNYWKFIYESFDLK